jgi:tetratricopeptide (TPR) repeat protein
VDHRTDLPKVGGDPLAWLLVTHEGKGRLDEDIRKCQAQLRGSVGAQRKLVLERLGWLFIAKAQESFDPGYYGFAEKCAVCLAEQEPGSPDAILLLCHALQNQHRFKEAEALARELAAKRGLPVDYGLLGDALMEQGQLGEATEAYQTMIDLRPGPHSYARGAHIRWLKGDLAGATELMRAAAEASSPQDANTAAWTYNRLAMFHFQAGAMAEAEDACDAVLAVRSEYPPTLLLRGRMLLAQHDADAAIDWLERAVRLNPLPEYQWALADALRASDRESEATRMEATLRRTGIANDPRTLSLYLVTRGEEAELALRLAEKEFHERQDVFAYDALAWALAAAGRLDEAQTHMTQAMAEGTQDARLLLHAAVIAARSGQLEHATEWLAKGGALMRLLLPSEINQFEAAAALISQSRAASISSSAESL